MKEARDDLSLTASGHDVRESVREREEAGCPKAYPVAECGGQETDVAKKSLPGRAADRQAGHDHRMVGRPPVSDDIASQP